MRLIRRRLRDVLVGELCGVGVVLRTAAHRRGFACSCRADNYQLTILVFDLDLERRIRCGLLHERAINQRRVGCPLTFLDAELIFIRPGQVNYAEVLGLIRVLCPCRCARQDDLLGHGGRILRSSTGIRVLFDRHREGYRYLNGQRTADVRHQLLHVRLIRRRLRDVLVGELRHIGEVISCRCSGLAAKDLHILDKQLALLVVFDNDLNLRIRCGLLHERAVCQRLFRRPLAFLDLELVGAGAGELDLTEVFGLIRVPCPGCLARQLNRLSHIIRSHRRSAVARVVGDLHREGYRYLNRQRTADVRHQLLHMRLIVCRFSHILVREQCGEHCLFVRFKHVAVLRYGLDPQATLLVIFNFDRQRRRLAGHRRNARISVTVFCKRECVGSRSREADGAEIAHRALRRVGRHCHRCLVSIGRNGCSGRILTVCRHREVERLGFRNRVAVRAHQLLHMRRV